MDDDQFFLGTHHPNWLGRVDVPLFVSHRRLIERKALPRASGPWALDSGAFSEVGMYGEFITSPLAYAHYVRTYEQEVGQMMWAAPQDHMCEAFVLRKSKIASTVEAAQQWTIDNYRDLLEIDATLPIIPVIQGQRLDDYREHIIMYDRVGIDLTRKPLVGIGSVCRRQATDEIANLLAHLNFEGITLHGFGIKSEGLARYGWCLHSADSMAWSYSGRRTKIPCPVGRAKHCGNCLHYALDWRHRLLHTKRRQPVQLTMDIDLS